jgi:hypothetical protein
MINDHEGPYRLIKQNAHRLAEEQARLGEARAARSEHSCRACWRGI